MSVLHIAAMPFPSGQGTQAAVRAMVEAEHLAGRDPELLTYAHGAHEISTGWPIHRIADLTRDRSLRSGPSWRKLLADAQLVVEARRVHARISPSHVVAHHVEATAAALAARIAPLVFVAHTALGPELPTYLPPAAKRVASRAGNALDIMLARGADAVVAVSPWLSSHLSARANRDVPTIPIPWWVPEPLGPEERAKARQRFEFGAVDPVFLYAGNLDAYQGVAALAQAFAAALTQRPDARFLVATTSDPRELEKALWSAGCAARARFAPLSDEPDRRAAYAAADLAWVPRSAEGGLPVKLLDALSRSVPTVVTRRACAGLDLADVAFVTADDDPEAIAAAALLAIEGRDRARTIAERGARYVRDTHSPQRYVDAMDQIVSAL